MKLIKFKTLSWIVGLLALFSFPLVFTQSNNLVFKTGERVCFVGNSITHEGEFTGYIALYYATRFPAEKISFFNAGIAGDEASDILARMDSDVLINHPTVTVLMVGMNDVRRDLYDEKHIGDTAFDHQKLEALQNYKIKTAQIADRFKRLGIKQVFELPTIYDETSRFSKITQTGINDALGRCADYLRSIAPKYQARLVDYRSIMNKINLEYQAKDSAFTIVGDDRVHPGKPGHLVMAYQFIKATGADAPVSKTVIDAGSGKISANVNCSISIKKTGKNILEFESLENALPYPVEQGALPALDYVDFAKDLNQEALQVTGLDAGNYRLLIDKTDAGTFTSQALNNGINLATDTLTPQYKQALTVMKHCEAYHTTWLNLRGIAFVEYTKLATRRQKTYAENKAFITGKPESNPYLLAKDQQYLTYKPKQKELFKQLDTIRNTIYSVNKPQRHVFELVKLN